MTMDSDESGCLSMWPRYLIRAPGIPIKEGMHDMQKGGSHWSKESP